MSYKHDELNEEGMNYIEIREDYDEKEEAALNEITDKTSKIHIDMNSESKKKEFSAEDEAIFEMLKQAELEEEMENERKKENEYEDFIKSLKEYDENNEEDKKGKNKEESDDENDDVEYEDDNKINFEHLKEKFILYKEREMEKIKKEVVIKDDNIDENENNKGYIDMSQIKNPADIYKHIYNTNEQAKKNKLKLEQEKKERNNSEDTKKGDINEEEKKISSMAQPTITKKIKENNYISNVKPKQPKKKKSSLFKSHMMEQRKKQGIIENNNSTSITNDIVVESNPKPIMKDVVKQQTITAGVKSIVQEHDVNKNYQSVTPKKRGKVSLFKQMAEAQHVQNDGHQNSNKKENRVPVMQNTIKENPNNTAMNEDDIDFYFTQREANQEYQKRKYQQSLIAKEKPLNEYNENDS